MVDARRASTAILIISIVLATFVGFNGDDVKLQIGMLTYAVIAAILILFINGFKKLELSLIGGAVAPDVLFGIVLGGMFIWLNSLNSAISLGSPQAWLSLGKAEAFIVIVVVAPIVEEFLFRGLLYPFIYNNTGHKNIIAIPLQAAAFAGYHYTVYGGQLGLASGATIGLFLGAFVFATAAGLAVMQDAGRMPNTQLERTIVAHMIFNFYLLNQTQAYLAIGGS